MQTKRQLSWEIIESILEAIACRHKNDLLVLGRRIVPSLTPEDILQPNDYPALENHHEFRYAEGVLAGIESVQMALRALRCELILQSGGETHV